MGVRAVPPGGRVEHAPARRPRARARPSSSTSSRRTAAPSPRRARARGAARRSPCGCRFVARRADRRTRLPAFPSARTDRPRWTALSVLVVDDDAESRDVVAAHLASRQARGATAGVRGGGARDAAARARGRAARRHRDARRRRLRVHPQGARRSIARIASIPAAALTAFAREEDRQRALAGRLSTAPGQADRGPLSHRRSCEPRRPSDPVAGARIAAFPSAGHISTAEVYMKSQFVAWSVTAAVLALGVGVLAQAPAQSQPTSSSPITQAPAKQITISGCVQSESDYRRAKNLGRGGAAATGVGAGNEFVIIDASSRPADAARDAGAPPAGRPARRERRTRMKQPDPQKESSSSSSASARRSRAW